MDLQTLQANARLCLRHSLGERVDIESAVTKRDRFLRVELFHNLEFGVRTR